MAQAQEIELRVAPDTPAPVTAADAFVQMVERAAANPAVDVEKLERLLAMRERIEAREAEAAFNNAMTDAQTGMQPVGADALNPSTKSKYASYAALDRALRPIYTAKGFSLSFDSADGAPENCVRVRCYVSHRAGHTRTYHVDMPADGKGAKGNDVMTKTHATGSAFTYGARYLLKMIFNVAIGEARDDDDGNAAGAIRATISDEQVQELSLALTNAKIPLPPFLKVMKIDALADLPTRDFDYAKAQIAEAVAARAKKAEAKS